jgi:glycosyltransferase involved in cell wall biosynthesis
LVDLVRDSALWRDYAFSAWRPMKKLLTLCAMLQNDSVHVIHCFGPVVLDFVAVLAARLTGTKSVVTRPVMISDLKKGPAFKWLLRRLDRFTLQKADRVVAISEHGRQTLLSDGCPASRLVLIHNGVDTARFGPEVIPDPHIHRWRGSSFTIGMFAQMTAVKRHDLLVQTLAKAVAEGRDWRAVFAGDGPLRDKLESLTKKLEIRDRVLFLGFVQDPGTAYAACDVITLPSDREGFPTTILEAMACGKPVVASDTGGVNELLDNLGILIKKNTVEDLFSGLADLEDVRLRQNMGRAGRKLVADKFGIDVMIRRHEELYLSFFPNLQ